MKKIYPLLLLGFLTTGLVTSIKAQEGFDVKKRKGNSVQTSSLNPIQISGANKSTTGRAVQSKTILPRDITFQKPALNQPRMKVIYSTETGLPAFITSVRDNSSGRISARKDPRAAAQDYINELRPVLQLEKTDVDFSVRRVHTDNFNKTHIRLDQEYNGIPVYGGEVVVHLNAFGEGESFNGHYIKIKDKIESTPAISERDAIQKISAAYSMKSKVTRALSAEEKKFVQYADPHVQLVIYQDKGLVKTTVLAYHIIYCPSLHERWEYFVDASTGAVLHQFESTCFADGPRTATGLDLNGISRTVNTYQVGTTYYMLDVSRPMFKAAGSTLPDEPNGGILTIDMSNTSGDDQAVQHVVSANNVWSTANQTKALSAHFNAGVAYEYFRTKHNRKSIDDEEGTIISIINVPDENGDPLDNAYWNGKAMFYGNGDAGFKPLAGAIDVAGHEMTHGVVQTTANLEYQGESGAINESMADIFGSMMDPADWLIGEDVVKTSAFPSGALRSLSDPHNGGTGLSSPGYQPKHKNEAYTGTQDNGGVHINSGIPNHAFFKYAEAITRDKAAAIYYKALDEYLTKSSQFIDLRLAIVKAAGDIYGTGSNEVTQAGLAFDAVGITNGQGGDYTETLPSNPGSEFMLVYNTAVTDPKTLYRLDFDGQQQPKTKTPLTSTAFVSRPSVTDQGDVAVFVAADNTIHVIITKPGTTPTERVLQDEAIWSNVVVSKGGSKIAAVRTNQEAVIYVYDFESEQWATFDLYNPTYTEGVNSAGPVYADALEWDYTGEFLVYDCFNRIDNATGADIEYWDVNFIHVWDREAKDFADGTVEKLFASLPDGVSIGNPSFAKNSPNVLAFDYVDETDDSYAIFGCNIETSDVNFIALNETLGWPSYNKADTRLAFTTLDDSFDELTSYVNLNGDKISSDGNMNTILSSSRWPVYFATGARDVGDDVITDVRDEEPAEVNVNCYPNPASREVTIQTKDPLLTSGQIELINAIGQRVYDFKVEAQADQSVKVNLENLKGGYYILNLSNARKQGDCKIMKK